MAAKFQIDTKEFERDFRRYMKTSGRAIDVVINSRMYFIIKKAIANTPIANKAAIEQELREVTRTHTKSGKKLLKNPKTRPTRRVYKLVNYYRALEDKKPIWGKEMTQPAKDFIAKRLRGVGALKSGWLAAAQRFARAAGSRYTKEQGMRKVAQRSLADIAKAKNTWRALAKVIYRLTATYSGRKGVHPFARAALEKAFAQERLEMNRHVEEKLQKHADKTVGR